MADLTGELRAWPQDTWAKVGVDPHQVAQAVIGCWQDGEITGLQVDDLGFEEARSLTPPAMTYVRGQLRGRLPARVARVPRPAPRPPGGTGPASPWALAPSHQGPPTGPLVPVAAAPAGRTADAAVRPRC